MKNLSIAILAALSILSFAGCKKKGGSDVIGKMSEFRDQMCKCTDKACADKVMESMTKWTQEMAKDGKEAAKPTEDDMKKSQAISEEYTKCMQKVMTASMTPPPAAPPPAGDKPADPAAAPPAPPAGDKPADPAAAAPPAGDKPADPAAAPPAGDKPK